jgi:mono/diheme cytochrome c family protein
MSRSGIVASAVVLGLVSAWLFGLGGGRVSGQNPRHGDHGTPTGWRFSWPAGDIERGRSIFARYECFSCHEVRGKRFLVPRDASNVGPELSSMGSVHEVLYFVEAIVDPNAVVERGKGYDAADGSSKMPSFNDTLTVQELVDLVAYLEQPRPPPAPAGASDGHGGHVKP